MGTYIDMALAALVAVYIVDVSGFTDAWRSGLARWLKVSEVRPLPPFDCGTCMAWWTALAVALCEGQLTFGTVAASALLSLLAAPAGQLMILIREALAVGIGHLTSKL